MIQPGTIVVCLKASADPQMAQYIKWLPVMDENTPYMIRDFIPASQVWDKVDAVTFEEGIIGHIPNGGEIYFPASLVREILPAEDISEEVEDMMLLPMDISEDHM